jgi:dipeptidyl aminopeptidase/acylaminoacyl peptidase
MLGSSRSLALVLLVGCGSSGPPTTPTAASPPAAATTAPGPAAASPPAGPAATEPTMLTDAQRQQDAETAPLAQSIVDAYPNWNGFFSSLVANWSPDGKHIVFGSVRDGTPQIYASDPARPGDPATAVTSGPERALSARYTLDGTAILFLRDTRGDENHHIWRINVDGTGLTDLTPGEPWHRTDPVLPSKRPDIMLYSASRTRDPSSVLFEQPLAGGPARQAYINPRPGGLAAATPDGKRALFVDVESSNSAVLTEIDVQNSMARRIYPPEGKTAGIASAAYAPDGARIYVATDEGAESSVLLALDARTGKQLARYVNPAPRGAPLTVVPSPAGDRLAVHVSAGNHGELRLLDARTLTLQRPIKVPLGDVQIGTFRPDGKQLSLLISLPDRPADVYTVDVATGEVHPLRADPRAGLAALPRLTATIANVPAFDKLTIPINVYLPATGPQDPVQRRPTIVIFHGGPASSYAIRWSPYVRFFVSLGYAVLEPNVRGSTGFGRAYEMADNREKRADWLRDLETVNAWTRRQPWCDPARVVVWGQSYGGYTTLMALTRQPALWRAGVDLYGVADLKKFLKTTDAAIRSVFVTEFGDLDKDGALLDQFSPMRDADKITAPLFVYAGQNDPRVPRSESDAIVRALRARNVPVEYMVAASEGHTVDRRETKIELLTRTARFLAAALK